MLKLRNILIIFCILFFIAVFWVNHWIQMQLKETTPSPQAVVVTPKRKDAPARIKGPFLRKARWEPNRKFMVNVIYSEGQEIARFKSMEDKIYDVEGTIPDRKVKFINKSDDTFGFEHYLNNKRHGPYEEYYPNGQMSRQARFIQGKLLSEKIYFSDGNLRMEVNKEDALRFVEDIEAGEGKVYRSNGVLMYEWNLTNKLHGGYKKSYNQIGVLVQEKKYDQNGELIEVWTP